MKIYKLRLKKTVWAEAFVKAENEDEAVDQFNNGQEYDFEELESYNDFVVDEVEEDDEEDEDEYTGMENNGVVGL